MLYVDTGILTKWYLPEADSAAAEHLDCSHVITGDRRQAWLAEAIGLPLVFHQP